MKIKKDISHVSLPKNLMFGRKNAATPYYVPSYRYLYYVYAYTGEPYRYGYTI